MLRDLRAAFMTWRSRTAFLAVLAALGLSSCSGSNSTPQPEPSSGASAPALVAAPEPSVVSTPTPVPVAKAPAAKPAAQPVAVALEAPPAAAAQAVEGPTSAPEAAPEVAPVVVEPEIEPAQDPEPQAAAPAAQKAAPAEDEPAKAARKSWGDDPRLEGMFVFDRGEEQFPVAVARNEELTMNVRVKLGITTKLGTVTLTSRVVPHRGSVLVRDAQSSTGLERAELIAFAKGGNALYHLEEERKSLLLPQAWPRIRHTSVQTGTESRKREQEIGLGEEGFHTRFRGDHHCGGCELRQHFVEPTWAWQDPHHCKKCKRAEHRVWREWQDRPVPEGTVDMVTAVMLGRSMLLLGERDLTFPLIDEEKLWQLRIRRGRSERIEVDAGEFDATEILLETQPAPGEDADPEDFKGLFGIHGTVSIWFDTRTGVPVQISGVVPLGPFTLDATVELASYRGTPAGFAPVE